MAGAFTFTGPEQIAAAGSVNAGAFYWQRPNIFLHGSTPTSERFAFLVDSRSATWRIRAYLRNNNAGTWSEQDAGNGPAVSKGTLGGLQTPFACPTYIKDPLDPTKIICAFPRAADSTIAFVLFDMTTKTFGVPVTGGPVARGVDQVFNASVSNDDTGAKVCVQYRASDNKLLFIFQGPTEVVNTHTCLRPYYVTYDRTGAAWGVETVLTGAGLDDPFIAHGITIDPNTNVAHCTVVRPPNGKAAPNNVAYQLWHVAIDPDDTIHAKDLMADTVNQTREPLISYPVLRPSAGSFELMAIFMSGQTLATIKATVVRGMVGVAPTWSTEDVSTDRSDAPGDGSFLATCGIGFDSQNVPYAFWFADLSLTDFFYRLMYSTGGDAGQAWATPAELFRGGEDDGTDFLDNGPAVSMLDGIGSIGFGIVGFATFITTSGGATVVDGVAYFEFIPAAPLFACTCQIAFQGVRRLVGPDPFQSQFRYKPKSFTYIAPFEITVPAFLNFDPNQPSPPIVVVKDVDDYDFELHEVKIVYPQGIGLPSVVTKVLLYDQNRYPISNIPMLDVFLNALGYYKNGAVMNPLFYQRNSQIRMELFSVLPAASVPVTGCEVHFVGIQRYPC